MPTTTECRNGTAGPPRVPPAPDALEHGRLRLDFAARTVALGDRPVEVTRQEFRLLSVLMTEPTRVFTKAELLTHAFGWPEGSIAGTTRTLDSHACRLRRVLSADGDRYVVNVWGVGYRLTDPEWPA